MTSQVPSSALGAQIHMKDGRIAYDTSPLATRINSLAAGESLADTLTYSPFRRNDGDGAWRLVRSES